MAAQQEAFARASYDEAASCVESAKRVFEAQEPVVGDAISVREEKTAVLESFQATVAQSFALLRDAISSPSNDTHVCGDAAAVTEATKSMEVEASTADATVVRVSVGGA